MNRWVASLVMLLCASVGAGPASGRSMRVTNTMTRTESESTSHAIEASAATNNTPAPVPTPAPALARPVKQVRIPDAPERPGYSVLKIANFESKEERNDYDGGYFGVWTGAPDDETQGSRMKFYEPGVNDAGCCLQIDYDVDSFHNAFNGLWLLFIDLDLSPFTNLCFWVRGDVAQGYTTRFNLELKNEDEVGRTLIDNITPEWQLKKIPLNEFYGIMDWTKMTELVVVFEDRLVSKETGTIYIDDIYFEAGKPTGTEDMGDTRMTSEEAERAATRKGETAPVRPSR